MRILLISSKFYGYEQEIINELKRNNEVYFFEMDFNFFQKIYYKILNKKFMSNYVKNTLEKLLNKEFDLIICIYNSKINREFILNVMKRINFQKIYLYIWDDLNRVKNFQKIRSLFDKIYSFDKEDCEKENLIYRPTFYSERLKNLKNEKSLLYKYFFIGEYRRDRYELLKPMIKKEENPNNYFYFYCSIQMFIKKYFFDVLKKRKIFLKKISKEQYNKIFLQSEIVIDIPEKKQKGLTQRILDGIYLEKKIITTNENIKFEKFYNANNILVVKNFDKIDKVFLETPYIKIERRLIEYYSINRWVNDILEGVE